MRKQVHHTPKRKCSRCLYERRDTEKVSERIWPPAGGWLCPECLVPAAVEALEASKERTDPPPKDERPFVICPECHRKTYDAGEIKQGFCGHCEWWTSHPELRKVKKADRGS